MGRGWGGGRRGWVRNGRVVMNQMWTFPGDVVFYQFQVGRSLGVFCFKQVTSEFSLCAVFIDL